MRVFFSSCAISVCVCMYQTGPYAAALNAENQWKSGRNNSKYIQVPVRETQLQAFQAKSENHTNSAKNSQNVKKCLPKIRKKSHPKELQEFSKWPALSPPPAGPSGEHPLDIFRRSGTLPVTHHPPPGPGHPWSLVEVKFITWESHIPYRFCRKEQRMSSWHVFLRDQSKRILTMDEETPKCFYQASCLSGRRNCLTLPYYQYYHVALDRPLGIAWIAIAPLPTSPTGPIQDSHLKATPWVGYSAPLAHPSAHDSPAQPS